MLESILSLVEGTLERFEPMPGLLDLTRLALLLVAF
jgi:hypothetical protein